MRWLYDPRRSSFVIALFLLMEDIFPILEHLLPQCLWDKEFSEGEEARRWQVAGVGCGPTRGQPFRCQAVVDEVDILFDPDFIGQTPLPLRDDAAARNLLVSAIRCAEPQSTPQASLTTPLDYPFNFILTYATIPAARFARLDTHHPDTRRLVSLRLHRLPAHLAPEFALYTSGNCNAELFPQLKAVWRDNPLAGRSGGRSCIIVSANTRTRTRRDRRVPLTACRAEWRDGPARRQRCALARVEWASRGILAAISGEASWCKGVGGGGRGGAATCLTSHGLDFDPSLSHVFVLELPRNTADFLHLHGRVVVFGRGGRRRAERRESARCDKTP